MARARLLKIGFFENEELAQLPDKARLLYAGLWLLADRAGRLEDRPLRIRGQLFPYEMVEIGPLLERLAGRGFIRRYVVGDVRVIDIPKFLTHQNPHVREPESKYPAFSQSLGSASARTVPAPGQHQSSPAVMDPVIDPVRDPDPVKSSSPSAPKARAPRSPRTALVDERFERFWKAYPKHVKRAAAEKAWAALKVDDALERRIFAGLEWQAQQPGWREQDGKFIPHPASWLNGRRWEDEPFQVADPTDAAAEDWQAECSRTCGGRCGSRYVHAQFRAAAAS